MGILFQQWDVCGDCILNVVGCGRDNGVVFFLSECILFFLVLLVFKTEV